MNPFPSVYPITDREISGLGHLEQVRRLAGAGARIVQLRDKSASSERFYKDSLEVVKFASANDLKVIINDRVDIALAVGAAGVHLGQDDLPPSIARELLGGSALIGFSTHSPEQAEAAAREPVDYIAIGPVFGTSTKEDPDPVVGLAGVSRSKEAAGDIPLIAIGGITSDNAQSVLNAGADSVAVISGLLSDPSGIAESFRRFTQ